MTIATPSVPANMDMENLRYRLAAGDARVAVVDLGGCKCTSAPRLSPPLCSYRQSCGKLFNDNRACDNMHLTFIKPGNPVADMFENPFIR